MQGLAAFSPKWIGIFYNTSFTNADMALIEYSTIGVRLDLHILDYYAVSSTFADKDDAFASQQGSQDVVLVLSAYDSTQYLVGSMKRKYETGDINRDSIISSN